MWSLRLRRSAQAFAPSALARTPCRWISGSQLLRGSAPQFTEEQIREISKHDAVLAEQIRQARGRGVQMQWQDLEDLPVGPPSEPYYWPKEGGPPKPLSAKEEKKEQLSIAEGAKADVKRLWEAVRSTFSGVDAKKK
mmetsp:Transcript_37718/g.70341  ORF Transcript_37718/g.70341 Transcript_37718/m.70341 type:complete len:137 (-) Transcript_37718:74-484(-)